MKEIELKEDLLAAGVSEEEISKLELPKIEEIIREAENIDDVCTKMKEAYPSFNEAEFRKSLSETAQTSEETQELSEEALEEVAGGSAGKWIKDNYETICRIAVLAGVIGVTYVGGKYLAKNIINKMSQRQYQKATSMAGQENV